MLSLIKMFLNLSSMASFLEKLDQELLDHQIKDQVQNESNEVNKLIGMIDCSST